MAFMAFFNRNIQVPSFSFRSEAFDYYFAKALSEGKDEIVAAEQADKFADIVAKNKRLPDSPPPPMTTIQKGVHYINQIVAIKNEHPELWSMATSVLGGLIGGIAGGATAVAVQDPPQEKIDFDKLD